MNTRLKLRTGLFGCLALSTMCLNMPLRLGVVVGNSMSPSLRNGSMYLLDRTDKPADVRPGDVVVFRRDGVNYIKRVVAVGGDQVYVTTTPGSGQDELVMDWQLGLMKRAFAEQSRFCVKMVARKVPAGCLYVVGDHMAESVDSRQLGPISTDLIIGKLVDAPAPTTEMSHLAVVNANDTLGQKS